jgi:PAS domain S-box-containing protein
LSPSIDLNFVRTTRTLSLASVIIAMIGSFGWLFQVQPFEFFHIEWAPIKFYSALGILLVGGSLFISSTTSHWKYLKNIMLYSTGAIAVITLVERMAGRGFTAVPFSLVGLGEKSGLIEFTEIPSPITAIVLLIISSNLLFREQAKSEVSIIACEASSLAGFLLILPTLISYFFGVKEHPLPYYAQISTTTALALGFLSAGSILSLPRQKWTQPLFSTSIVGKNFRMAYLVIAVFTIVCGWLLLQGELLNFYDSRFGVSTMVFVSGLTSCGVLWYAARKLEHSNNILEERRREAVENELRLRQLANSMPQFVWSTDANGKMDYMNDRYAQFFGCGASEITDNLWARILKPEDQEKLAEAWYSSLKTGQGFEYEFEMMNQKNKTWAYYLARAIPIKNSHGTINKWYGTTTDITETKLAQKGKFEAEVQANAALESSKIKSEFLANMSHEIRTPLNGIIGMTGLLRETPLNTEQSRILNAISRSSSTLINLINDILDLSKVEAGKMDLELITFNLEELIRNKKEIFQPLFETKNVEFKIQTELSSRSFYVGDSSRIQQILSNLLGNALKFTNAGYVHLIVEVSDDHSTNFSEVRFYIKDTGIGIPKAAQQRLFQNFSQADSSTSRKFGGTGLGLSICKQLAELMGGKISMESEAGEGSTFCFSLPLPIATDLQIKNTGASNRKDYVAGVTVEQRKAKRILVAEDNIVNQEIVVHTLINAGYKVEAVASGREAVVAMGQIPYDAILMDCQMPDMDGYEATTKIRELGFDLPIIALTANAFKEDRALCLKTGMSDYLTKPMQAPILLNVLDSWLGLGEVKISKSYFQDKNFSNAVLIDRLDSLAALDDTNNGLFLSQLLEMYEESIQKSLEGLHRSAEMNDENLSQRAHALKSSSSNIGAHRVSALLQRIEDSDFQMSELAGLFRALEVEIQFAIAEIRTYIETRRSSSAEV